MKHTIALFGESEKGAFKKPHIISELPQLVDSLGNPPKESFGLFFAIQALLYDRAVVFFRVAEEGFSTLDYMNGLKFLKNRRNVRNLSALCLPGVGDPDILNPFQAVCHIHKSFLITGEKDFYDYLTT